MGEVSYDGRSFFVGGERIWIVGGAIHYFRVPRGLWRDRLLKLKRAGCNTVQTYVAWNFHEEREGSFDFSGERDLEAFIETAEELGLWVIARPGPYICAEWDNGGIPAWLPAKPGVELRTASPAYHDHIRRWFGRIIPIIARHQATRGGRVILVQAENEYCFSNRPGGREHLEFLRDLLREIGIDVPIIGCNMLYERVSGTLECWNCWNGAPGGIETLSRAQPDAPRLLTEFWTGWYDVWGRKRVVAAKPPREVHSRTMRITAAGAQQVVYMFHGGTNFGHFAGRAWDGTDGFITTSDDYDAPLSETGALTGKYFATKLAATPASNLASTLATSEAADLDVSSPDEVEILARRGEGGSLIFVFNRSERKRSARLRLPGGERVEVSFKDLDALVLPWRFSPVPGFTIDYSNLSLLGMAPMGMGRIVFLHGPEGTEAVLSAQGRRFERKVGAETQVWFGNFPNLIAVMGTERAERTWFLEDRTVVGADFAGEIEGGHVRVACRKPDARVVTYFPNGRVAYGACSEPVEAAALPELKNWEKVPMLPAGRPSGSRRVDSGCGEFRPLEEVSYTGGYGWYYTELEAERGGEERLLFTDAEDRLTVFVNGARAGTFGRGEGASMEPVKVRLKHGPNDVHVLLDHLGRANFSFRLGETKGIRGPVYLGARRLRPEISWTAGRYNGKLARTWQVENFWPDCEGVAASLAAAFSVGPGEGAVVRLDGVAHPAALFVNRTFRTYFWGREDLGKLDVALRPDELGGERNLVEVCFFEKPEKDVKARLSIYAFDGARGLDGAWNFAPLRPERPPAETHRRADSPAAWETTFDLAEPAGPVVLSTDGLVKGEAWLNGRSLGRHWNVGPYRRLYLPETWLSGENRLVVFDEFGTRPSDAHLEYDREALFSCQGLEPADANG